MNALELSLRALRGPSASRLSCLLGQASCAVFLLGLAACAGTEVRPSDGTRAREHTLSRRAAETAGASSDGAMPGARVAGASALSAFEGSNPQQVMGAGPNAVRAGRQGAPSGGFGSPVVRQEQSAALVPVLERSEGGVEVRCEGRVSSAPRCPQCPASPDRLAQRRAALSQEQAVLACEPPFDAHGRLAVRLTLRPTGEPSRVRFASVEVDDAMAQCLGRALCAVRTGTFRDPEARLDYEYVIATEERR